jgi:hypothetical protein
MTYLSTLLDHWVYITIPLLFFGVRAHTIEDELLVQARQTLGGFLQLSDNHSEKECEWVYLCEEMVRLWRALW